MVTHAQPAEFPAEPERGTSTPARPGGRPRAAWVITAASALGIAAVQYFEWPDPAWANIYTLILAFVACITWCVWLVMRSGVSRALLWTVGGAIAVLAAALPLTVRIEGVSGQLVPRLAWRWSPTAEERAAPAARPAERGPVDLATTTEHDYPGFLGPRRDGSVENPRLSRDWNRQAPQLVWKQPIGAGWSSFAVVNGFAVTMEQRDAQELVTCYKLESGKLLWSHAIEARHATFLGGVGPRSTPTIHQGKVYALGATGLVRCLDGNTGNLVWKFDVLRERGVTLEEDASNVAWGRAASPLVVDDLVVVPAGGPKDSTVSLIALHRKSGSLAWQGGKQQVAYASPNLATLDGVRQILTVNESSVTGHDLQSGRELWKYDWPGQSNAKANVSQAVQVGAERVLISKGYGGGAALFRVARDKTGRWSAERLVENNGVLKTKLSNVVLHGGYAYGLSEGVLQCAKIETLESRWKRGRYGYGQVMKVGELLLVQSEDGEVALVDANPDRHVELGRFQAVEGKAWNNPALYGPYLLVRSDEEAACYKLPLAAP